ncbi:MAG TPA: isochorismatase family protein [Streptosporangiaceae bacterium]|nr:isochorismatase family protein [Streptosporangiaceae bacterium]
MAGIPDIADYALPTSADLPENTAGWTPDARRVVLLVHDMQRYFLAPFSRTGLRAALIENVARLRERARELGIPVAYTAQPGRMTETDRGLLKDFWGPGMRMDPADRQIVDPLEPGPEDRIFTKWRYSAFFRSDLLAWTRRQGRDQIVVCGVYAHVGVLMTAVEAFTNDIEVFLPADAIADFSPAYHRLAIDYAAERCAVVGTVDRLLALLGAEAGAAAEPAGRP